MFNFYYLLCSLCMCIGVICDVIFRTSFVFDFCAVNPLNAELNPVFYLLALLGAHHFLHISRIRVKLAI
jgi:hypothetical protein